MRAAIAEGGEIGLDQEVEPLTKTLEGELSRRLLKQQEKRAMAEKLSKESLLKELSVLSRSLNKSQVKSLLPESRSEPLLQLSELNWLLTLRSY